VLEEFSEAFLALAQKEMKKELFEEFKKRYLEAQNESVIFIANLPIPLKSF
jgi:hypothetical protein